VVQQFRTTVAPMAEQFVRPTLCHADVIVSGDAAIALGTDLVLDHVRRHLAQDGMSLESILTLNVR